MALKPVLIIQHARYEHPAALRRALETQGIGSLWIHPYRGDAYPSAGEIRGVISLGGPMSSNDEQGHPWIREELRLLNEAMTLKLPILGICLGGQLLARSLGHRVQVNPVAEVGWYPLILTEAASTDRVFGTSVQAPTVYHFHFDTFELPSGAVKLASSEACANQAYRIEEHAYGLQFHPEADHQLLGEWLTLDGFEQEIEEIRDQHGTKWIQGAKEQIELAHRVELESISLVTAFSTLFRPKKKLFGTDSEREALKQSVKTWELLKVPVQAEFRASVGGRSSLRGVIERHFSVGELEFIELRGEDWLVWPIALDDLRAVTPVSK